MKIGIIGCGFVGTALKTWVENNQPEIDIFVSDPFKGFNDDVYNMNLDAYFLQIHTPTLENGEQDINPLIEIVNKLPKDKPCWIRTTITPNTYNTLHQLNDNVNYMPEFLTERTYIEDFKVQPMVFTGKPEHRNILKQIFVGKKYIEMTNDEASMAKYAHNVFGALKVTYFNCIKDLCDKKGLNFNVVRNGILASGYINEVHTFVPGPDGKYGYGGKCFPKDVNAMEKEFRYTPLGRLIEPLKKLNDDFRCK